MTTTMMAVALKMTDAGVCAADDIDDDDEFYCTSVQFYTTYSR